MDEPLEKHLGTDARRRRFDAGSKWGGRGGRTLFKAKDASYLQCLKDGYTDVYMKISRPRDEDCNVLVTQIDQELEDLPLDEGKGGHLFKLPEMLEAECLSKTVRHDDETPDILVTTYTLQGVAWMTPTEEERLRLQERRDNRLSLALPKAGHEGLHSWRRKDHRDWKDFCRVWCKLRDTPLDCITEPSLLDFRAKVPNKARVFEQNSAHAMTVQADIDGEVDLGEDCRVTWVSTQGRFPPTQWTLSNGIRIVNSDSPEYENWVTKYELSYRVDGGRQWIVARACFDGNKDMTTEVAHAVDGGADGSGLRCRYLRFRPLEFHRAASMRVGVYGVRLGAEVDQKGDGVPEDTLVRYSIYGLREQRNRRRVPGGQGLAAHCCMRKCCRCHRLPPSAVRRMRLRAGAVDEVRRLTWKEAPREALGEALDDTEAGGDEPAPAPRQPGLTRTRSRSESDLLRASEPPTPTSTVGSSAVVIGESGIHAAEAASDAEDWLLL